MPVELLEALAGNDAPRAIGRLISDGILVRVRARRDTLHGERVEPDLGEDVDGRFEDRLVGLEAARSARCAPHGLHLR